MISDQSNSSTHASLIRRAQHVDDQLAWSEFVQCYGQMVIEWCRRWCKQEADAYDLTQDILLRVWKKLPDFCYEAGGSFRGWLWTLSRNAFIDSFRRQRSKNEITVHEDALASELDKQAVDFAKSMQRQFDVELLHLAYDRVRHAVDPVQWQMFERSVLLEHDAAEVAQLFGKSLAALRMNNVRLRRKVCAKAIEIEESLNHSRN